MVFNGDDSPKKAPTSAEPEFVSHSVRLKSAAEEQPQQDDDRYRHAQQPEQDSTSHIRLLEFLRWSQERESAGGVPASERENFLTGDR
jgi:hypothetical protein